MTTSLRGCDNLLFALSKGCCEVVVLHLQLNVSKVDRPTAVCSGSVQLGRGRSTDPLRVPLQPMKAYELRIGESRSDLCLNRSEEQRAMSLRYNTDASPRGLDEDQTKLSLSTRMEVNLRLLDEQQLARGGGSQGYQYGQRLRCSEPDICDIHQVASATANGLRQSPN